eukprot:SAG31_NODE_3112_length_4661_cov_9.186760_5_plen_205_part_00
MLPAAVWTNAPPPAQVFGEQVHMNSAPAASKFYLPPEPKHVGTDGTGGLPATLAALAAAPRDTSPNATPFFASSADAAAEVQRVASTTSLPSALPSTLVGLAGLAQPAAIGAFAPASAQELDTDVATRLHAPVLEGSGMLGVAWTQSFPTDALSDSRLNPVPRQGGNGARPLSTGVGNSDAVTVSQALTPQALTQQPIASIPDR